MKKIWKRWDIKGPLAGKYFVKKVVSSKDALTIQLSEPESKKTIELLFDDSVTFFAHTDEIYNFKISYYLSDSYGLDFYKDWTFF